MQFKTSLSLIALALILSAPAFAKDKAGFETTLKDHKYTPSEIKVPAGKDFVLKVTNADSTAEEFESHDLDIEKVVAGNSTGKIHIKALKAGKYTFVGEYHEETATGVIIAE